MIELPPLDQQCPSCLGIGRRKCDYYVTNVHDRECYECSGLGRIPTPAGEAVLEFIKKYLTLDVSGKLK